MNCNYDCDESPSLSSNDYLMKDVTVLICSHKVLLSTKLIRNENDDLGSFYHFDLFLSVQLDKAITHVHLHPYSFLQS